MVNYTDGVIWRFLPGERERSQQFTLACRARAGLSACAQMSGRISLISEIWPQQVSKNELRNFL